MEKELKDIIKATVRPYKDGYAICVKYYWWQKFRNYDNCYFMIKAEAIEYLDKLLSEAGLAYWRADDGVTATITPRKSSIKSLLKAIYADFKDYITYRY